MANEDSKLNLDPATGKKKKIESRKIRVRLNGRLKFYDKKKRYGFITTEDPPADIFVHFDDLKKAGIDVYLKGFHPNWVISVQFCTFEYEGKYGKTSQKAVDIKLVDAKYEDGKPIPISIPFKK